LEKKKEEEKKISIYVLFLPGNWEKNHFGCPPAQKSLIGKDKRKRREMRRKGSEGEGEKYQIGGKWGTREALKTGE